MTAMSWCGLSGVISGAPVVASLVSSQAGIGKAGVAMGEGDDFGAAAWVRAAVVVGRLAEQRAGLKSGRLDKLEVHRMASRQLGRPLIGNDPGLRVLLADLAQAPLTPLGRVWLRSELIRRAVTRGAAAGRSPPPSRPARYAAAAAADGGGWPATDRHHAAAYPAGLCSGGVGAAVVAAAPALPDPKGEGARTKRYTCSRCQLTLSRSQFLTFDPPVCHDCS
jgi:hypothetical protein